MATKPAPRKPAAKPAPIRSKAPAPVLVADTAADPAQPDLKRQELLEQVVARSDVKKKFAKPVLEAALALIGEALAEGRDLNLAPMGKVKINRTRKLANGRVMVARIRQTVPRAGGMTKTQKRWLQTAKSDAT
jgi:DNA-binding protein HU-alpha